MASPNTDTDESELERATREFEAAVARSADRADWCRVQRDKLIAIADGQQERREDAEGQDRIGAATVAKLYDTALKFERLAAEHDDKQLEGLHDRMLIANKREMDGRAGSASR